MKHYLSLFFLLLPFAAYSAAPSPTSYNLTIYSKATPGAVPANQYKTKEPGIPVPGYAMIRQKTVIDIPNRRSILQMPDVAATLDPTTVVFSSLSHPEETHVFEQNYLFDIATQSKLLERYLGKQIEVVQTQGAKTELVQGILLTSTEPLILQKEDGSLYTFNSYDTLHFPALPNGLISRPTLMWEVATSKPGKHTVQVSYQAEGLTWWADYNAIFSPGKDANHGTMDLYAWVSLLNQSGTTYPDAVLKLIAGDVHRAEPAQRLYQPRIMAMAAKGMDAAAPSFQEKTFDEYHLYTLSRPVTLTNNATKQIELFAPVLQVPVEKKYLFNGQKNSKVITMLEFKNTKAEGLGIPLPAGRVRINKQNSDDKNLEFIGEDTIDHTPTDEKVKLHMGSSFDIKATRKLTGNKEDSNQRWAEEEIEITVKNHKKEAITIYVEENLYRSGNWKILRHSHDFTKEDANSIRFAIPLAAKEEAKVTYGVKYNW